MWYIFPQIKGLGRSPTAQYYAIQSVDEAKAFLNDSYLGKNLMEITKALLALETNNVMAVFGSPDNMKLKSCMTLFDYVSDTHIFQDVLDKFFDGHQDQRTLRILNN